jgi:hypothetical protein
VVQQQQQHQQQPQQQQQQQQPQRTTPVGAMGLDFASFVPGANAGDGGAHAPPLDEAAVVARLGGPDGGRGFYNRPLCTPQLSRFISCYH